MLNEKKSSNLKKISVNIYLMHNNKSILYNKSCSLISYKESNKLNGKDGGLNDLIIYHKSKKSPCLKWTYGLSGNDCRVASLSKPYLPVT